MLAIVLFVALARANFWDKLGWDSPNQANYWNNSAPSTLTWSSSLPSSDIPTEAYLSSALSSNDGNQWSSGSSVDSSYTTSSDTEVSTSQPTNTEVSPSWTTKSSLAPNYWSTSTSEPTTTTTDPHNPSSWKPPFGIDNSDSYAPPSASLTDVTASSIASSSFLEPPHPSDPLVSVASSVLSEATDLFGHFWGPHPSVTNSEASSSSVSKPEPSFQDTWTLSAITSTSSVPQPPSSVPAPFTSLSAFGDITTSVEPVLGPSVEPVLGPSVEPGLSSSTYTTSEQTFAAPEPFSSGGLATSDLTAHVDPTLSLYFQPLVSSASTQVAPNSGSPETSSVPVPGFSTDSVPSFSTATLPEFSASPAQVSLATSSSSAPAIFTSPEVSYASSAAELSTSVQAFPASSAAELSTSVQAFPTSSIPGVSKGPILGSSSIEAPSESTLGSSYIEVSSVPAPEAVSTSLQYPISLAFTHAVELVLLESIPSLVVQYTASEIPAVTTSDISLQSAVASTMLQLKMLALFSAALSDYLAMTTMPEFQSLTKAFSQASVSSISNPATRDSTETLRPTLVASVEPVSTYNAAGALLAALALSSSAKWLPSTLVIATSASESTASATVSGDALQSFTDLTPSLTSLLLPRLPNAITPATQVQITDNYTVVTIGFKSGLNYPFVVSHSLALAQIFQYLPPALTYAFGTDDSVQVKQLVPFQTKELSYIVTVAEVYFPKAWVQELQTTVQTPYLKLYFNPNPTENSLAQLIDPNIPLVGLESLSESGSSGVSSGGSGSSGAEAAGANGLPGTITGSFDSVQDSAQKANLKLRVVGTTSGMLAVVYISILLVGYRVYKKRMALNFTVTKDGEVVLPIVERGKLVLDGSEDKPKMVLLNPEIPQLGRRNSYQSMRTVNTQDAPYGSIEHVFGDSESVAYDEDDLVTIDEVNLIVPRILGPSDDWF